MSNYSSESVQPMSLQRLPTAIKLRDKQAPHHQRHPSESWDPVKKIPRRGHLFYWKKEAFYHWIPAFAGMMLGVWRDVWSNERGY